MIHELTFARREIKMETYRPILLDPLPLDGERSEMGAREPIKLITPTSVLPRRGEGIRVLPPVGFS